MLVEQVNGEAANLVGQVAACLVVDAARLRTQLDGLRDLVPVAGDRIELVHIRLDGGLTRARMVSRDLDELVDVLGLLLQDALGFHLVAVNKVIDQPGRMIFTAGSHAVHRFSHHLNERHRRQSVERILDGTPVVPLALRQFGFDLVERAHFRKTGHRPILIDVAQHLLRG